MGEMEFSDFINFGGLAEDALWGGLTKDAHRKYMSRCLELAERGWGKVSPNPMVGAVLVRDGVVVAEGWHDVFGGAHAERMLFEGLELVGGVESGGGSGLGGELGLGGQNEDFSDCILYVSLEPCAHFGKTPPCANLILEKGVGKVVVGVLDPNPKVSGKGVGLLRDAGVDVLVGVLEDECRQLNWAFWVNQVIGRTAVVAKWAETGDGFMGLGLVNEEVSGGTENQIISHEARQSQNERVLISGEESGRWVHHLRSGMDAILVGVNTWNFDKPKLNVRGLEVTKQPIRIVLDRGLRGEYSAEAVDRSEAPLWVIYDLNFLESDEEMGVRELQFHSLSEASGSEKLVGWGLELSELESSNAHGDSPNTVDRILQWLYEAHGLGVILVEGGASILQSFLDADCVDDIHILRNSQMHLGSGVMSPNLDRGMLIRDADFGSDEHWVWRRDFGGIGIETKEGLNSEFGILGKVEGDRAE
jgi:diaminohydroxyphosphoribosylaminopyrimidine deaminase/5-amino-6-(5-phosphoribosylamino)uracil reductase